MKDFQGKVAVVTGAASGIGRALAERLAEEGMKLVVTDIEEAPLLELAESLRARGGEAISTVCDVSNPDSVNELADACYDAFGACHVLCNNAGVLSGGMSWDTPLKDWDWVLGVNLYGVIHGLQSFMPRMQEQDSEGHIVNTASMAGVTAVPFAAVYHVSKHGVVALSECLYKELDALGSKLRVSVLCPELIDTAIADSDRNRHDKWRTESTTPAHDMIVKATADATKTGLPPRAMADRVVQGIRDERFYLLSEDDTWKALGEQRARDVLERRNPTMNLPEQP